MKKIPCIKDKCLLLPICKNNIEVKCDKIAEYMNPYIINNKSSLKQYIKEKRKIFNILIHTIRIVGYYKKELYTFYSDRGIDDTVYRE